MNANLIGALASHQFSPVLIAMTAGHGDGGRRSGAKKSKPGQPWSRRRIPQPDQSCYLYLFVHKVKPRLKIGISIDPSVRLAQLQEADDVDLNRSLVIRLENIRRARELEGMLHKALSPHRLPPDTRRRHGGDTEWFDLAALPLATQLILNSPNSASSSGFLLESFAQHEAVSESHLAQAPSHTSTLVSQLQVVLRVSQLLMQVAQTLPVEVVRQSGRVTEPVTVVLKGFRQYGCDLFSKPIAGKRSRHTGTHVQLGVRMQVMDADSYQLPTISTGSTPLTWAAPASLIKSLRYGSGKDIGGCVATTDDLVIHFNSHHALRSLSGGDQVGNALDILFSQLSPMRHLNERVIGFRDVWAALSDDRHLVDQ